MTRPRGRRTTRDLVETIMWVALTAVMLSGGALLIGYLIGAAIGAIL